MDERLGPHETAVCMGFDAMRVCLAMQPETFTIQQIEQWIRNMTTPSHEEIAGSLSTMANGSTKCPVCGRTYVHDHSPEELIIYRNGVKYGRSLVDSSDSANEVQK